MKTKNIILIGIILTTLYLPLGLILGIVTPHLMYNYTVPLGEILLITIMISIYIIGLLMLNMGLKQFMITKNFYYPEQVEHNQKHLETHMLEPQVEITQKL